MQYCTLCTMYLPSAVLSLPTVWDGVHGYKVEGKAHIPRNNLNLQNKKIFIRKLNLKKLEFNSFCLLYVYHSLYKTLNFKSLYL